ncbi:hypothetical protein Cylst_1203 [Cylindrospermum stagnale PCC 7417]|uniref:Uncharacterized protein n=1 Tax=Cylindrospermum stagnale PCC 7417 TaxID=56107 RepID=K9WSZ9_9NOST|nr:hypothetical protein [Cylindrospermum stagnale]AFZ23505.1 hypothetical protein Cylst_1203 [Cylindrospermum stagnale PCC 7417]
MILNKLLVISELTWNFLGEDKLALREKQDRILAADVKDVLSCRAAIKAKTNNVFDSTRILGIVAATTGAENYLPYTIPKIIQQISEIGMMADIVIGLNNGFECPTVIDRFTLIPGIKVIHLYTGEKFADNIPAKIFDNLVCEGEPYYLRNLDIQKSKHRIFVVHQKEGRYSAGKIRILGDIYGSLFLKSIDSGWIPPAIMVTFDAESQFLVQQKNSVIDLDSNGLKLIVGDLQKHQEKDILGAKDKFAIFQKITVNGIEVFMPNLTEELPPMQWFIDIAHGRYSGFKWKPGGGTFGRFDAIVSLLAVISEKYPGIRVEDSHFTILAKHAGFVGDIFMNTVSTNRSPSITDMTIDKSPKKAWIEQMYRWVAGFQALKLLYGEHNIKTVGDEGFPWFTLTNPIEFLKKVMENEEINVDTVIKKIKYLAIAFFTLRQIRKRSRENPDILQGSGAKAFW